MRLQPPNATSLERELSQLSSRAGFVCWDGRVVENRRIEVRRVLFRHERVDFPQHLSHTNAWSFSLGRLYTVQLAVSQCVSVSATGT